MPPTPKITTSCRTDAPLIRTCMISHGTLNSVDLQQSRRFYEEVLGLEVLQHSPLGLLVRQGSDHAYVVVETGEVANMTLYGHNGIDVATREEVDRAYTALKGIKDEHGIRQLKPPMDQHGAYSFYLQDRDGNWWEILHGRGRGYMFAFEENRDITGRADVDPDLMEHAFEDDFAERLRTTVSG